MWPSGQRAVASGERAAPPGERAATDVSRATTSGWRAGKPFAGASMRVRERLMGAAGLWNGLAAALKAAAIHVELPAKSDWIKFRRGARVN